jgi:hypothetical protein
LYRIILNTKAEGKKQLGRSRCTLQDIVKVGLTEIGCEGVDCIQVAQGRVQWQVLVNVVTKLWIP